MPFLYKMLLRVKLLLGVFFMYVLCCMLKEFRLKSTGVEALVFIQEENVKTLNRFRYLKQININQR